MANGLFSELDDEARFCAFIKEKFSRAPTEIAALMHCEPVLDDERIRYAFNEYQQALKRFSIYLHSENPDHYKRAGALMYALAQADVIVGLGLESTSEELEAGFTRVHKGDADFVLKFVKFYEDFHNEAYAFQVAFRCCAAYEKDPREIDEDYVLNICRWLKCDQVTVDACFIAFKSLMM